MTTSGRRTIVVMGATGLLGGAVARRLLTDGWHVRAVTRKPSGQPARALAGLGAEVVQGDMDDPASLRPIVAGAYGVYSVQNPFISGPEGEVRQGRNVGDAARASGVQHFVYASAGTGERGTGVPSWETKLQVEEHLKALGLPLTILRPMAFMELMTVKKFFPAAGPWHIMPALMGPERPVIWICTDDLAAIVSKVFADPRPFIGKELALGTDVQSLDECRALYREALGKAPPRFPMPVWLFERFGFVGRDLTTMWRWLRTGAVDLDTAPTRAIHPEALTVREWLGRQKAGAVARPNGA